MPEFSITSSDFEEGGEIPKKCGYKFDNVSPNIDWLNIPDGAETAALIMDDPDATGAVGKVWVHWLLWWSVHGISRSEGKNDFGEIGYGGPAPPDGRHTYIFKVYALDVSLDLDEGYSKQELEDAMEDHIIAEAKLTGTFAP